MRTALRWSAATLTIAWPLAAAGGLWLDESQPGWADRVGVGTLLSAALVAALVVAAGPSPVTPRQALLRRAAGLMPVAGLVAVVGSLQWWYGGCSSAQEAVAVVVGVLVLLLALAWPWVVLEAPDRTSRWWIGPAAGIGLAVTSADLFFLVELLSSDACGT